jgi:hypothetical protein
VSRQSLTCKRTGGEVDLPGLTVGDDVDDVDFRSGRQKLGHLRERRPGRAQQHWLDAKLQLLGKEIGIPHRRVDERHLARSEHDAPERP